ncbi:MAG: MmcQ/YjbR family DNA-binding protein [Candidatus Korobacteraceae bacterium]
MTADQFRKLVLSFPDTEERAHHGHPDFRVGGKIFATLGYPDQTRGMVQLTPEQQAEFVHDHPQLFAPAAGKWGQKGSTIVNLPKATKAVLKRAAEAAWKNAFDKVALKRSPARALDVIAKLPSDFRPRSGSSDLPQKRKGL